jgi:hypothetical protein
MTQMNFNDTTIAHIVKLLQVAILSGTDIVDHMRQLTFIADEDQTLTVSEESQAILEETISQMMQQAPSE